MSWKKPMFESNLGWDSIKTCLLCTPLNPAQDCASLEKSSFILSLSGISVLGGAGSQLFYEIWSFTCYGSWCGCSGSRINRGGPVIWHINISYRGLSRVCFFPHGWSFKDQPPVQHPPSASQVGHTALWEKGALTSALPAPSHQMWLWGDAGDTWPRPFGLWSCCWVVWDGVFMAQSLPQAPAHPRTSPGPSCLFSECPYVSAGLRWVGSVLSYTHWCQWGCVGGIRRRIWLLVFLFLPPPPYFLGSSA